jgi:hypothetical protein
LGIGALLLFAPLFDRGILPEKFSLAAAILLVQLAGFLAGGALAAAAFHLLSSDGANLAAALTLPTYEPLPRQAGVGIFFRPPVLAIPRRAGTPAVRNIGAFLGPRLSSLKAPAKRIVSGFFGKRYIYWQILICNL